MAKKLILLLGVCLLVVCASSAFAAVTLKRLGDHPFYPQPMTSEADLRGMVEQQGADLQDGFAKAGNAELYPEFMAQFPTAKIETIQVAPGERFDWMLFKNKGTRKVKALKDVTWGGDAAFDAYSFHIDMAGQRYEFIVPAVCGNLALRTMGPVPAKVDNAPTCIMTLSSTEVKCGKTITVDATGSTDSDGTISEVVFQLLDGSNQVVAEQVDKEAPFVQDLAVPCESSQYTVKTVVIDNYGNQSSPAECTQTVMVVKHKGGPVIDVGVAHQFDPATYVFGRVGYEYPFADKWSVLGFIGGFAEVDEDDNEGDSAFTADALVNYYFNEKLFAGGGIGYWSGHDGELDLIVNMGYLVYEKPGSFKTSLFVEGRCFAEELISSSASRLGLGVRFHF